MSSAWDIIVIGAGAAGLLAAARAAELGRRVLLLEKNRRAGVKILMSGGTRCNITQATDRRGIVAAFGRQGPFLHSALAALGPDELVALIEAEGVRTKVEPTGKIFPLSNKAADVLQALLGRLDRSGAELALGEPALSLRRDPQGFTVVTPTRELSSPRLIVTTGGRSYPGSGTTGDGYGWAQSLGHSVVPCRPALVPLRTEAPWVRALMGLTLADVRLQVLEQTKVLDERRGGFLFAHFGLSGPAPLDISRVVSGHARPRDLVLRCDFLPARSAAELETSVQRIGSQEGRKTLASIVPAAILAVGGPDLPHRLIEALIALSGVPAERRGAELSRAERGRLVQAFTRQDIPLTGTLGFEKAEVTAGGVPLEEIDPRSMQSRLVPGLYFAGEVLDLDGPIGGYNFQAAFSTGWLAGTRAAGEQE